MSKKNFIDAPIDMTDTQKNKIKDGIKRTDNVIKINKPDSKVIDNSVEYDVTIKSNGKKYNETLVISKDEIIVGKLIKLDTSIIKNIAKVDKNELTVETHNEQFQGITIISPEIEEISKQLNLIISSLKKTKNQNANKKVKNINGVKVIEYLEKEKITYTPKEHLILKEVYQKVEDFLYPYKNSKPEETTTDWVLLFPLKLYLENSDGEKTENDQDLYKRIKSFHDLFLENMYNYVYFNVDSSDKTKMFFQNIVSSSFVPVDENNRYKENLDLILRNLRNADSSLKTAKEEEFLDFMDYLAKQYMTFVNPDSDVNLLLNNKSFNEIKDENRAITKSNYNSKILLPRVLMWICIITVVIQVIVYFNSSSGNLLFFISSIIATIICGSFVSEGKSQKEMTCQKCNQWNSLKIIEDEITDSDTALRSETYYEGSGNNQIKRERQYTVRVEMHKYTCRCDNCGNIEIKYAKKEYRI